MNMQNWIAELKSAQNKKPLPLLSFPAIQLLDISVEELISSSERQAEGMIRVAERTDALASVSMMDLSVEAEAFGSTIHVSHDEVPSVIGRIVTNMQDAEQLAVPEVGKGRTGIYVEAIRQAAAKITDRPIFAGVIGPYSLAGRLMDVNEIMINCYEDPELVHTVIKKCTEFIIAYSRAFRDAGANGVVIAEPLSGMLSPALIEEFSTPYIRELVDSIQTSDFTAVYHNCGNNVIDLIDSIKKSGTDMYHFGNAIDLCEALALMPEDVIVMGNIDPAGQFRNGTPESIREATLALVERCRKYDNFVLSSGCDIPPLTPWENIDAFFEAAKDACLAAAR